MFVTIIHQKLNKKNMLLKILCLILLQRTSIYVLSIQFLKLSIIMFMLYFIKLKWKPQMVRCQV